MATKTKTAKVESINPSTMEELLAGATQRVKGFKRGETIKGKIVEVTSKTAYVDIGGKAEAVVSESEFELNREYFKALKPGDEVMGVVLVTENDSGQVILSLRKAAVESKWRAFEQAMADDLVVTVRGKDVTKGGLLVDADGIYGFVPSSQFGKALEGNVSAVIGKPIQVRVIEVDQVQNRLVLSERAVSEAEDIEKRKRALEAVKIGGEYEGIVVGMVPFGAFVSVKVGSSEKALEVEGLVHISEISWEKVDEVTKALKEGEKVTVQVIGIDEESGKLALSMKRLTSDPWLIVANKYATESKHKGKVTKVVPYGVLVKLERGIEGLIHASKLPAEKSYKEGDEVDVFVESVDLDKRRLSLGVVAKDTKSMIYK